MRMEAIQRVLARRVDRAAISSLGDLRKAYEAELVKHRKEIAATADAVLVRQRTILRGVDAKRLSELSCANCGGPTNAKRSHRRYCSNRCKQQAYRQRLSETAP